MSLPPQTDFMKRIRSFRLGWVAVLAGLGFAGVSRPADAASAYVRLNQAGYLPSEIKQAILLSSGVDSGSFTVSNTLSGSNMFSGSIPASSQGKWSSFYRAIHNP